MNFYNGSAIGMFYSGRCHRSERIGTVITTKITFLKAISNIKISRINWDNDVEYYKNDTTLETDIIKLNDTEIYTITATKEQYGSDRNVITIANDITIGNVSVGDVLSFETKKEGTLDSTSDYYDLVGGLKFYFSSDPITITETVQVQKTRGINKPVSSIYAGVTATIPVYTETTTTEDIALSSATFTDFFSADNTGTTGTNAKGITWADNSDGGLRLTFGNYGIDSSTSMTTFTAQRDSTNVVIKGLYYTETRYDKITLTVAGTTVLNAVSGTSSTLTQQWAGSLSKGQTIVLKYVKDNSSSVSNESSTYFTLSCDPYQKTTVDKVQTGTETKLVDKKIIKGYVGVNGIAKLFFNKANDISYTGEYTVSDVSISGINYKLYTLTTSGSLTVNGESQYWICGGGASGNTSNMLPMSGGTNGGGGGDTATGILNAGAYNVTIGAGGQGSSDSSSDGNITSIGETITANGGKYLTAEGGSGGGEGKMSFLNLWTGTGSGISTIPFGIESLNPHCAGGGAGSYYASESNSTTRYTGGAGGTNGGNGTNMKSVSSGKQKKGIGGSYGGGDGGEYINSNNNTEATSATFYGGGGGGSYYHKSSTKTSIGTPGSGYQGVAYVLVPA